MSTYPEEDLVRLRELLSELEEGNPGEDAIARAEWRGRMTAVVEQLAIGQGKLEGKVDDLIWKVAGIAATISLLVSLVLSQVV